MKSAIVLAAVIALASTILGTVPAMRMYEWLGNMLKLSNPAPLLPLPLPFLLLQSACMFVLVCVILLTKLPATVDAPPLTQVPAPRALPEKVPTDVIPHTSLI